MSVSLKILFVGLVLFMAPAFAFAQEQKELVTIVSTKRYILHFKVDNSLIGGSVEVFGSDDKAIMTEPITHKKNIIDFFALPPGYYRIHMKKDDKEVNLQYQNFE